MATKAMEWKIDLLVDDDFENMLKGAVVLAKAKTVGSNRQEIVDGLSSFGLYTAPVQAWWLEAEHSGKTGTNNEWVDFLLDEAIIAPIEEEYYREEGVSFYLTLTGEFNGEEEEFFSYEMPTVFTADDYKGVMRQFKEHYQIYLDYAWNELKQY